MDLDRALHTAASLSPHHTEPYETDPYTEGRASTYTVTLKKPDAAHPYTDPHTDPHTDLLTLLFWEAWVRVDRAYGVWYGGYNEEDRVRPRGERGRRGWEVQKKTHDTDPYTDPYTGP